ncbi:pickpocket protein 28 [Leptinotarsa decemlineata]|uniref:pickpocket protein 28 n=1 Tax=Leptinotarsa decemlineata TaxID=7539 RepID=UPI003D30BE57
MAVQQNVAGVDSEAQCEIPIDTTSVTECTKAVPNKRRNFEYIKSYFRDYCENSSIIGFKYLGERRSKGERILWLVILLTAVALSVYHILEIYNKYEENPFIVNFATRESPISTIPFPAVTICPVVKATREKFNFTEAAMKIWKNMSISEDELKKTQYLSSVCGSIDDFHENKLPPLDTFTEDFYDQIHSIRPDFNLMFSTCMHMGGRLPCKEAFTPVILDDGVCYSFNILSREYIYEDNVVHYGNYHQNRYRSNWTVDYGYSKGIGLNAYPIRAFLAGADSALEIYLLQLEDDLDYLCAKDTQGFKVVLHTPHTMPQLRKQFIPVAWDTCVQAMINPKMMTTSKEVKKFKPKDRLCYFADERSLKYFKIYNPENCGLECLTNHTLEMCNCVDFYMPRHNSTKICSHSKEKCIKRAVDDMKIRELAGLFKGVYDVNPTCNCMPLCTELSYDIETGRTFFPWKEKLKIFQLNQTYELNTSHYHFSKLSVFFNRDQFLTSQRNELYGPFDFLANFGGLLGLFTGFSLLSAVEILYYLSVRLFCNFLTDTNFLKN